MANKILIDAAHEEETRVVVVHGDRVEEFDFESSTRKQLRGNIYLAKVTRVEPSLQAAFVDYGGNRHGFLAFSEIHPDYYQIPLADRQELLQEDIEDPTSPDEEEELLLSSSKIKKHRQVKHRQSDASDSITGQPSIVTSDTESEQQVLSQDDEEMEDVLEDVPMSSCGIPAEIGDGLTETPLEEEHIEETGGAVDAFEEVPIRSAQRSRHKYRIQEVIKRRQILLIQIVKEERGSKGAAVTTYLSMAGRYCVLMPNTARGGGISRKITNSTDRHKLKAISDELQEHLPEGMGVILRTAGASRTKTEIKRDFEYLLRLWEVVRELTLKSIAPVLVYEEGNLIKRSIRDLYSKEIEAVIVSGDRAYREAKAFMRTLMPNHARFIQPYKDKKPLFSRYGVEAQLDAMFSPQITLQSGGQIVINQTEALVAIDVNSGRFTRENDIENTALSTNLEAASEIARQLRLRDLAGLIVIDFIDMEEKRNQRTVERKLKDCLRRDRARIQVGRISHFGLLEMSRQRMRVGVLEGSTSVCSHCRGVGSVRSVESVALNLLRAIEEALFNKEPADIKARVDSNAAFYLLNHKRETLHWFEAQFGVRIYIEADDRLISATPVLEYGQTASYRPTPRSDLAQVIAYDSSLAIADMDDIALIDNAEDVSFPEDDMPPSEIDSKQTTLQRRSRRRRRGQRTGLVDSSATSGSGESHDSDAQSNSEKSKDSLSASPPVSVMRESGGKESSSSDTIPEDSTVAPIRRRRRRYSRHSRGRESNSVPFDTAPATTEEADINASSLKNHRVAEDNLAEDSVRVAPSPASPHKSRLSGVTRSATDLDSQTGLEDSSPRYSQSISSGTTTTNDPFMVAGEHDKKSNLPIAEGNHNHSAPPKRGGWWRRRLGGG